MLHAHDPLVPPTLFRSREFTVTNLATVLLYAAIGVTFFLVAYQLQVGAGWSALQAGTALLPATVLMLIGSARSGALAQRIGPRLQLTVGPAHPRRRAAPPLADRPGRRRGAPTCCPARSCSVSGS